MRGKLTSAIFDWSYQGYQVSVSAVTRDARRDLTWPVTSLTREERRGMCPLLCLSRSCELWTPKYLMLTNTVISHSPSTSTPSTPAQYCLVWPTLSLLHHIMLDCINSARYTTCNFRVHMYQHERHIVCLFHFLCSKFPINKSVHQGG